MSKYIYIVVTTTPAEITAAPVEEHAFESADELIEFLCDEKPDVFSIRKLWGVPGGEDRIVIREKSLVQGGVVIGRIPF